MTRKKNLPQTSSMDNGQPEEQFPFGANAREEPNVREESPAETPPQPHSPPVEPARTPPESVPPPAKPANHPVESPPPSAKPANPWSRENLRLNTDISKVLKTERHQNIIPVDKPSSEVWFRVHDDPDFAFDTKVLWLKEGQDRGIYQIHPDIEHLLLDEKRYMPVRLVFCIDRQGEWRIWPLRILHDGAREDDWMTSALTIVEIAKEQWIKLVSGKSGYEHKTTPADIPDPVWPNKTFDELLDMAFRKRRIDKPDDAVLLRLLEGK